MITPAPGIVYGFGMCISDDGMMALGTWERTNKIFYTTVSVIVLGADGRQYPRLMKSWRVTLYHFCHKMLGLTKSR